MTRMVKFTIWHGFAASLAVHSALALPFVVHSMASPPEDRSTLVIELQGVVADSQTEQKILQQTKGPAQQEEVRTASPAAPPPDAPPKDIAQKTDEPAPAEKSPSEAAQQMVPPRQTTPLTPGAANVPGVEERRIAQTIRTDRDIEADRLNEYVKAQTKKIKANLVKATMRRDVRVSFTIAADGQIRPDTLKIVASSGQQKLDASALATVRASAPFEPPPKEITLSIVVGFGD